QLENLIHEFAVENCRGCPHRRPNGLDTLVGKIIREFDQRQETAPDETPVEQARYRLHELVSGDLTEALRTEEVTVQSVLRLVALLEDERHDQEAGAKLGRAAALAPE